MPTILSIKKQWPKQYLQKKSTKKGRKGTLAALLSASSAESYV